MNDGQEIRIAISGHFEFEIYREFREAYSVGTATTRYHVDLSRVDYLDSSALGMLLLMRDHAGGDKADITLSGLAGQVSKVLDIAGFERLFTLRKSTAT